MRISDWSSDVCSSDLLLIEDQCFVVALDRERRIHRVLLAKGAERAAAYDLRFVAPLRGDDDVFAGAGLLRRGGRGDGEPGSRGGQAERAAEGRFGDRTSGGEGKRVSVSGDPGGWRELKK